MIIPPTVVEQMLNTDERLRQEAQARLVNGSGNSEQTQILVPTHYPDGRYSGQRLTTRGVTEYLRHRGSSANAFLESDVNCTPEFSPQFLDTLRNSLTQQMRGGRRSSNVIMRPAHTVAIMRENDKMWLLDSYNAHGAVDRDHVPLLRFLRDSFPNIRLLTSRDKIQNDYHHCSHFSIESVEAIEHDLQNTNRTLEQFVRQIDTGAYWDAEPEREQIYRSLGVETVNTPAPVVRFAQSLSLIDKVTANSDEFHRRRNWISHGSYANLTRANCRHVGGKLRNCSIERMANEFNNTMIQREE